MSTKIYNAFKLESIGLNKFIGKAKFAGYCYSQHIINTLFKNSPERVKMWTLIDLKDKPQLALFLDGYDDTWYGIIFARHELCEEIMKIEGIVDFHYQNQTDRPEEISEEDWEHRKEVWDRLFMGSSVPAETGLMLNLFPSFKPLPSE